MAKKPARGRKKPQRKKGAGLPTLSPWLRRRLILVALLAALSWLGVLVTKQLAREAYGNEVFEVDPARIALVGLPDDLPGAWRLDLDRAVQRMRTGGRLLVFEDASLERVEQALADVPWIHSVDAVARRFPDGIEATVRVRLPVARITDDVEEDRTRSTAWVDREGVLLPPPGPPEHPDWKSVPLVVTERVSRRLATRLPPYGQMVPDLGVLAGAATAQRFEEVLSTQDEIQLLAIDASEHARIKAIDTGRLGMAHSEIELYFRRTKVANGDPLLVSWGSPEPYLRYVPPEGRPTFEQRWNLLLRAGRDYPRYARLASLTVRYGQYSPKEIEVVRANH